MSRSDRAAAPSLAGLQRWMQAVVVSPEPLDEALAAPEARQAAGGARVDELILPSATLEPAERIAIYKRMYPLRMIEALEQDYPILAWHVGEEAFEQLVLDYVEAFPSRSYTLNRLGDNLPVWLDERCRRDDAAFLGDLARFELAQTLVFDEQPSDVLAAEQVARIPSEAWAEARLPPIPALRLLTLRHAIRPHCEAWEHDRPSPAPRRRATRVLVWRRGQTMHWREMPRAEYELLDALVSGETLGRALEAATARLRTHERQDRLFGWFRRWVSDGLFRSVALDASG